MVPYTLGSRFASASALLLGIAAVLSGAAAEGEAANPRSRDAVSTAAAAAADDDTLELITRRRVVDVAQFPDASWFADIPQWLASQRDNGTWSDVDYTSGCAAQRANWPIQEHLNRLITFGAAWSGANPIVPANWTGSDELLDAVSKGLDFWFDNDFNEHDCIGSGGVADLNCPCGTPGLWNTNWYDQAILIPQLMSHCCLLVREGNLTETQRAGCQRIPQRAYDNRDKKFGTTSVLTGSNAVLLMQNSVSLALFTKNSSILEDAFTRAMAVMTFSDGEKQDGIHRDGSFLQHDGLLYNGNYGKDLLNAFIQLEGEVVGTPFSANDTTRDAMSTFIRGNEWMIFIDEETLIEHWDFNVIGRFVAFPVSDLQANADINFNVSKLGTAVSDFAGSFSLSDTIERLSSNGTSKLTGNKGFWASDYMVHRRDSFMLTNKMLSNRSLNSESVNDANPLGYHLGQGTLFAYVDGTEYRDIMGSWDWSLVPGTTLLLNRPEGQVATVAQGGKRDFVGVVSDGKFGTSVEDYIDPLDGSIAYRKAWFFVDEGVIVTTTAIETNATGSPPVITVLDNRAAVPNGRVFLDGKATEVTETSGALCKARTLSYGGNGYLAYDAPFELSLSLGKRTGNWSAISTSTAGKTTEDIFSAYTTLQATNFTYGIFPAMSQAKLAEQARSPTWKTIAGDGIDGLYGSGRLSLVFWPEASNTSSSRSITLDLRTLGWADRGELVFTSGQPAVYLVEAKPECDNTSTLAITLADPTQQLAQASFSLRLAGARVASLDVADGSMMVFKSTVDLEAELPRGGLAGSSVAKEVLVEWGY